MSTRTLPLILAVAGTLAACVPSVPGSPRPNMNRLTREQIVQAGPSTVWNLIQNQRPIWLRERGNISFMQENDVVVYVDGTSIGGRETLRDIYSTEVEYIEFYDARRATYRFGAGHVNGAILIVMRQ